MIGLPGILISTIVAVVFIYDTGYSKVLFNTYFRTIQGGLKEYWARQIIYLLSALFASTVTVIICSFIKIPSSLLKIIINGVICAVIPNLIFILIWRNLPEFDYVKVILNRILGKLVKND